GGIGVPEGYMLVPRLRAAVKVAACGNVEPSVDIDKAVLSVLSGMISIKLRRGAAVQVQGVPRKAREQVEARLERRNQIGCRSGARKDVAVVGLVELAARKPKKSPTRKPTGWHSGRGRCVTVWPG